jgi:gliding motility-associated-like protein
MQNGAGLLGSYTSTQSALVVPKPSSDSIYYLFTADAEGWPGGLRYSEININIAGGLGGITANKNILLLDTVAEKLVATKHANGKDIWVMAHDYNSNDFYSFLVTTSGVNPVPLITSIGTPTSGVGGSSIQGQLRGYMKFSPNGKYLATCSQQSTNEMQLFSFDNSTGIITSLITTITNYEAPGPYGVEFSPSNKLLYVSDGSSALARVIQYDLTASNIALSEIVLDTILSGGQSGALQLGPDRKIYATYYGLDSLAVINNPDNIGQSCNYVYNSIYLNGAISRMGLPNYISSYFASPYFTYSDTCSGLPTYFSLNNVNYDSVYWNFGDPLSGNLDTSTIAEPSHIYQNSGQYVVNAIVQDLYNNTDTLIDTITITQGVIIDLGNDTVLCPTETLLLDATNTNGSYLWSNNSIGSNYLVTQNDTVWVEVSLNNGCINSDTMIVSYDSVPQVNLGDDDTLCYGYNIILNATNFNANYLWSNNTTNSTIIVSEPNTYWVLVTTNCGTDTDSIKIEFIDCDTLNLDSNSTIQMPNVFTPNGDGVNDLFLPINPNEVGSATFTIYNRWGSKLFESFTILHGWDGRTTAGAEVTEGTYFWVINYQDLKGDSKTKKGFVELLKD